MKKIFFICIIILIVILLAFTIIYFFHINKKVYYGEDFGIETILSDTDYNNNGIDDYTEILIGARQDAENKPTYKNAYYAGGYPPDNEGVCTDVIWRALKNAGYTLKDLIDEDIKNNINLYPRVNGTPDKNIDFRRVDNLRVFFSRYAKNLTTDINQIEEWQPGDIVTFGKEHIGIISDKRNERGIPYLIHNSAQPIREEDVLEITSKWEKISGHFRFEYTGEVNENK